MIGLSLSACIKDIIEDKVDLALVTSIMSNTRAQSPEDWALLHNHYSRNFWASNPTRALEVLTALREADRIFQPRLQDPDYHHSTSHGHWHTGHWYHGDRKLTSITYQSTTAEVHRLGLNPDPNKLEYRSQPQSGQGSPTCSRSPSPKPSLS